MSNIFKAKSKEEMISLFESLSLNKRLIEIIKKSDLAYDFIAGYISIRKDKTPQEKVNELNGLAEIIIELNKINN